MELADRVFEGREYDKQLLHDYGFKPFGGAFRYETLIMDGQFIFQVTILDDRFYSDVTEVETGDIFSLYHVDDATGSFIGQLKYEAEKILNDIRKKCFNNGIFKCSQTKFVLEYVFKKYSSKAEYLWNKYPYNAVLRREDNKKWYAVLLTVERSKLGLDGDGVAEVIDLRGEPSEIAEIIDGETYFRAYHMNKQHWYTIILNNKISNDEMINRIKFLNKFNATDFGDFKKREKLIRKYFKSAGKNAVVNKPFFCDYGANITIGDNFYANFDCIILDVNSVEIGNNVFLAPRVCIYTAGHPIDKDVRAEMLEYGYKVKIGNDVWIGGNTVINPGVTIGDNVVIGSNSVVTKDIPSNCVACGNPCRVIREITEQDSKFWRAQAEDYYNEINNTNC